MVLGGTEDTVGTNGAFPEDVGVVAGAGVCPYEVVVVYDVRWWDVKCGIVRLVAKDQHTVEVVSWGNSFSNSIPNA